MGYERLIARRYIRSKRQLRFINIIMIVSLTGITVGVAALIIVLSVFNGFNAVVTGVLVGFDPHVRIESSKGRAIEWSGTMRQVLADDRRIAAASPFIASKALLIAPRVNRVVLVRGVVDSTAGDVSGVKKSIVLGTFNVSDTMQVPGIVIGIALADRLGTTTGAEIDVVSPVGVDAMMVQFGQPLTKRFVVAGIFDSNNKDYDANYAFIPLSSAQELFQYGGSVSGVEIRLHDMSQADAVKHDLRERLGDQFTLSTWYDLHQDLYSVMRIERWSAYIILCLIVGVATFNVLGSLTMGVIEKRRDIGILKAMGATRSGIARVFMIEGMLVGSLGTVMGAALGLFVCYLQIEYQLFPLDPTVYIIPAIPVDIRWTDFIAVSAASMLLSAFASLYPAVRAGRLMPVDAIRWE